MRWLWAALLASGCLKSASQTCVFGDQEWVCPVGLACAEPNVFCGRENEVAACAGHDAFAGCTFTPDSAGVAIGSCVKGVCNACQPATEADLEGCTYAGWKAMTSPVATQLRGVWVVGRADAYAVGDQAILHYDGNRWAAPAGLPVLGLGAILSAVLARATDDVFVTASGVGGLAGDVLHFDGAAWTVDPSSSLALNAITGSPTGEIFVAGARGTMGVIRKLAGGSWTESDVGGPALSGVWASAHRAVAVGGQASGVIWRSDSGAAWMAEVLPPATPGLTAVWGSSDQDIVAVGRAGGGTQPTILHFDGSSWSKLAACDGSAGACIDSHIMQATTLFAVHGTAAGDAYAVGQQGTILHYDGTQWSLVPPSMTPAQADLTAVSASAPAVDVFAVTTSGGIWRNSGD